MLNIKKHWPSKPRYHCSNVKKKYFLDQLNKHIFLREGWGHQQTKQYLRKGELYLLLGGRQTSLLVQIAWKLYQWVNPLNSQSLLPKHFGEVSLPLSLFQTGNWNSSGDAHVSHIHMNSEPLDFENSWGAFINIYKKGKYVTLPNCNSV